MATLPSDVAGAPEFQGTIQIESPDYTDYELLDPGFYTSPSREVTVEQRTDKNGNPFVMAKLEFSELLDREGNTIRLRRPVRKFIFSFMRKERNHKGETSEISKYLKAAGIQLGGAVGFPELKDALLESAGSPVKVRVGWTNRTPKVGDTYLDERAYTNDFNRSPNGGYEYSPVIQQTDLSGMSEKAQLRLAEVLFEGAIKAKHRVEEFDRA
jgi:hypothetical protein